MLRLKRMKYMMMDKVMPGRFFTWQIGFDVSGFILGKSFLRLLYSFFVFRKVPCREVIFPERDFFVFL